MVAAVIMIVVIYVVVGVGPRTLGRQHADRMQPVLLHQVRLGDHQHDRALLHGQHRIAGATEGDVIELDPCLAFDG